MATFDPWPNPSRHKKLERRGMPRRFKMVNGFVPGVVLPQTCFTMRLGHVNVAEMQKLVCGGVMHPHGLFAKDKEVAQGA